MDNSGYPGLRLGNDQIQVSMLLPDATHGYYRGSRFDWSGIIERVECGDHRFYAPLHAEHDPIGHDCVSGPAEEFAMAEPMGYDEAADGESFVKIGVGLLRKTGDAPYAFNGRYEIIRTGDWDIEQHSDRVVFLQDFEGERGWAYRYRKVIRLVPGRPHLVIEHRLENTGQKTIDIDNYNHNFTLIDDVPYGPGYRVEFPFATDKPVSVNNRAWFRGNAIEIDEPLGENWLWMPVYEGDERADYNASVVRNLHTGASVGFDGDAPVHRMVFWAVERAACPEPFIRLHLQPGQHTEWKSRYRYGSGRVPKP